MNTSTEFKRDYYNPLRFLGTLGGLILAASLLFVWSTATASGVQAVGSDSTLLEVISNGASSNLTAALPRFAVIIPLYFVFLFLVSNMTGYSWKQALDKIRDHFNNDSIMILTNKLTKASTWTLASVAMTNPTNWLVTFAVKLVIMLAIGSIVAIIMNIPHFGLSGRKFVNHICDDGSDALARNTGDWFEITAILLAVFNI